jgi:hypothetical protein
MEQHNPNILTILVEVNINVMKKVILLEKMIEFI